MGGYNYFKLQKKNFPSLCKYSESKILVILEYQDVYLYEFPYPYIELRYIGNFTEE